MASLLVNFIQSLTPPPVVNLPEYDGLEYRWRFFVLRPAHLKNEVYIFAGLFIYIAFIFWGKYNNHRRADKWFEAHLPILQRHFSSPSNHGLTRDGHSDFFNFSTGRRGVTSLHTIFTLRPRHDFFQYAFQVLRTFVDLQYKPSDEILLDFKLPSGPDFVWAIVAKDELLSIKEGRWDLTFTRTTESSVLPPSLSVMSEYADITEAFLKISDKNSIFKALSDPAVLPYFRSLSVTDQPRERPTDGPLLPEYREKHVLLSLSSPPPSDVGSTITLISAVFNFIDSLQKVTLRPETKSKLKKTREDVDKELKEDTLREKKEEAAEDRKAAKWKAEQDRISRLSAADQKKQIERQRKRALRKSQTKTARN